MLDTDTRRRIDTARDILVGKVPDPKSQVEQITIALIYKFMDDMDAHAEELGGQRKFFAGDFARYGWAKLMRAGLGGQEVLNLYAEAIAKMPENPGIPLLFRNIFRNAYLPYRDPETLKSFLKIIDDFTYDHSERLGDAFEYLLSVLGSQGDAGQFRTPRHIIDFIVDIVDPKKNETILDPACGTAGFLISSYKHILRANSDDKGRSKLTPDEKGRLAKNLHGYDISPDMVRLSLVNLYLHGFTDPHIDEYDTLTSEAKWNETADVILANPPFMSPKGGIKPHRRFSVQSKRSEVLFVDYMAEHLSPTGRAGIIVPEGIIFQSQGAYTELRKMLVEKYLVAVISLPAGVFNPYSGVKTSVLILDKSLARQSDSIGFFKVENDGFGLGAQRRGIDKNDLPQVKAELGAYFGALQNHLPTVEMLPAHGLIVPKERIAANGHFNLSGEGYREGAKAVSAWPFVAVGNVFQKSEKTVIPDSLKGPVTYVGLENLTQETGGIEGNVIAENPSEIRSVKNIFGPRNILYGKLRPNLNKVWMADRDGICSTDILVLEPDESKADPALYAVLFRSKKFNGSVMSQLKGAQLPRVGWSSFAEIAIPLPPLDVQKEIVAEIEGYQKVIDGARAVLDNYRPYIPIDPNWPIVQLGEVLTLQRGYDLPKQEWKTGTIPIVGSNGVIGYHSEFKEFGPGVVTGRSGTIGKVHYVEASQYWPHNTSLFVKDFKGNDPRFVQYLLESVDLKSLGERTAAVPSLDRKNAHRIKVALPPLNAQQAIVAEIQAEQSLIATNRELIARFEKKIQATLARVWSEDEPAAPEV